VADESSPGVLWRLKTPEESTLEMPWISFDRVISIVGNVAERRCLSDRATGVVGAALASPVYAAIGLTVAYFAWWPFGAVFTLLSRLFSGYGVTCLIFAVIAVLGRFVARAMTFPSSVSFIQRQIEREVGQRVSTKLLKAITALAGQAAANPLKVSAAEGLDDALKVLRHLRDNGDLTTHGAFFLYYAEVVSACARILAASAGSPGSVALVVPQHLQLVAADATGATHIAAAPVPSVFSPDAVIKGFAPTARSTAGAIAWLVRGCAAGTLRANEVADVLVSACAVLSHTAVWCETIPAAGEWCRMRVVHAACT
jgi:hypothetical protein